MNNVVFGPGAGAEGGGRGRGGGVFTEIFPRNQKRNNEENLARSEEKIYWRIMH